MNSQDNSLESNDRRKSEIVDSHDNAQENLDNFWTEENSDSVTDFYSENQNQKNTTSSLQETAALDTETFDDEFDLDLDNLDFRNPPQSEDQSKSRINNLNYSDDYSELDLDLDLGTELENDSDRSLDLDLGTELENDSDRSLDLDDLNLNETTASDNHIELNLDAESEMELVNEAIDDLDEIIQSTSSPGLSLLRETDNLDNVNNLDELIGIETPFRANTAEELLDNSTQSLPNEINPGSFSAARELTDLDNLLDTPSDDKNLDNLDNLLDLEAESLELDETTDFKTLESSLEASEELSDLDSLLDAPAAPDNNQKPQPVAKPAKKAVEPAASPKAQVFDQTMRVSVRKLDDLNNLIGELVVKRNRLEEDQERLRRFLDNLLGHVQTLGDAGARMHDLYERSLLEGALIASRQSSSYSSNRKSSSGFVDLKEEKSQEERLDALEMDRFTGFHLLSQEIIELIVRVREAASDIQFVVDETDKVAQTFRQVTSQLQDGMNSSRMVPFGQTADRLPRAIRDISRKLKKQANLHVEGKDVLIDKMIVEHLYNPMTHLVNNAISHGIETPEERIKRGKPGAGNITIHAFIQGNQTVIKVSDDGAGINAELVKSKAVEKKLITWAKAQTLSKQEVYELLFHPGFSTKDQADDFAGRGVGMDVVSTDLKKIRGSISIESQLGQGTTFTIRLPLVLSICKALTCVDNNNQIAFPIDGVEDTQEYLPSDIETNANGVKCISWQNNLLPLRPLSSLLSYNRQIRRAGIYNTNQNNDDTISVVILRSMDNFLAIQVDEVKAEQEIVIKQIDGPIPKPPGIAGATVLGDGTIMAIGDVLELVEIAQGKRTIEIGFNVLGGDTERRQPEAENVKQEPTVLVVDDSITVRELLSLSFNKLGYRVEQARDGQEAWDKLRGGLPCDMIFSDIEMPRMNGLELLSNLQKQENLRSIPVAMLTSRGADKHRQIASELGAKAYLTKPYTEKDLMDVAQHLIEVNKANHQEESSHPKSQIERDRDKKNTTSLKDSPLVLIIDDSVTVRELLSMTFKKAGYRVEQARDGQEAWEKLRDGLDCDLAFCDIEMPRMNGLELLSQLQNDEKLSSLPIAMLTSRGAQKMRSIAAQRGAKGYFVKPYVEDALLDAAKRMINGEVLIKNNDLDGTE